MALLYGLRYKRIGNDTIGYVRFFEGDIREFSMIDVFDESLHRTEVGYRFYAKIISFLTDNYTIYFLITAVILFGVLIRFANKYTENPFVFLFMFMTLGTYHFYQTGLRQALAMTVCLIAVDFVHNKKLFRFVLTVLIAATFHKSAYIFLILYPMARMRNQYLKIAVNVLAGAVAIFGFTTFQEAFNRLLGFGYDEYIDDERGGEVFVILITLVVIFSLYTLFHEKGKKVGQDVIVQMTFLTVIFWILRLISRTAERISFYFMFGMYIYFSQTFKYEKDKYSVIFRVLFILVFFALFIFRNFGAEYQFFWQGE